MFDDTRERNLQARRPILAVLIALLVSFISKLVPEGFRFLFEIFCVIMIVVCAIMTWQWIFAQYVDSFAAYKDAATKTPASVTAEAMKGLDPEARKLLGQLHTLSVGVIPGNEPEIMIYGTNLTLDMFLEFLEASDDFRLISIRNYSDGPERHAASEFVNYCVLRGWAIPARMDSQNEPAHWITGWSRYRVKAQFGSLLGENTSNPRAGSG